LYGSVGENVANKKNGKREESWSVYCSDFAVSSGSLLVAELLWALVVQRVPEFPVS
jgi:hypothetical protein